MNLQRVTTVTAASALLTLAVVWVGNTLPAFWRWWLLGAFFGGHFALAFIVCKDRLRVALPANRHWIDFFVVLGACWFGPAFWFLDWKKANRIKGAMRERDECQASVHRYRLGWVMLSAVILILLLFWFKAHILL